MKCRHCGAQLKLTFVDLGSAPPSNSYLTKEMLDRPENLYPLRVMVCEHCWLVQTEDFVGASDLFSSEYAYFSSYSTTWVEHAKRYVGEVVEKFGLNEQSLVIEVGANDGYLLQYFKALHIPCLGIEPTKSTAIAARKKGIDVIEEFFGLSLSESLRCKGKCADLIVANNVLAHVPDIDDFVTGFTTLLKPDGFATFEFPHLMSLVTNSLFDTVYHEHFSYLSFTSVKKILESNGLQVFDIKLLETHGGSLRVFAQLKDSNVHLVEHDQVNNFLELERNAGVLSSKYYSKLQARIERIRDEFASFLLAAKKEGKVVCAYGAAAKGNTLLNFAQIGPELIEFVVDRNPMKQGKYLPGSHIPIRDEEQLRVRKPDYIVVLPWNLREEIIQQLSYASDWGARFVTAIPSLTVTESVT